MYLGKNQFKCRLNGYNCLNIPTQYFGFGVQYLTFWVLAPEKWVFIGKKLRYTRLFLKKYKNKFDLIIFIMYNINV